MMIPIDSIMSAVVVIGVFHLFRYQRQRFSEEENDVERGVYQVV